MEKKNASKLMFFIKSSILIALATVAVNAAACGSCGYRCAYKTYYVTYKWSPGFYRNCCWVPGHRVALYYYKVHYRTCYPSCQTTCNTCNSCGGSFLGLF